MLIMAFLDTLTSSIHRPPNERSARSMFVFTTTIYCILIIFAAVAGGTTAALFSLGHRPMQTLLSFTGGVMLGVGLLNLVPHAFYELDERIDITMAWMLAGFFAMFLLERAFHGHSHHGHSEQDNPVTALSSEDDHAGCTHHSHASTDTRRGTSTGRWAWCGAFTGLALHSLADGAAIAASVQADTENGVIFLAGAATFAAVILHKPFDSLSIATLMVSAGWNAKSRQIVTYVYALTVPLGLIFFQASLGFLGDRSGDVLGAAMALAGGAFVCIAGVDLLPEVEFHSHDRLLLSVALACGIGLAWGIGAIEHGHADHSDSHGHSHERPHTSNDHRHEDSSRIQPGAIPAATFFRW